MVCMIVHSGSRRYIPHGLWLKITTLCVEKVAARRCCLGRSLVLSHFSVVISRRAIAIISGEGIVDQEYLDVSLEPDRKKQIPDILWRCLRAPRGGRRGLGNKVRHINEGIAQGFYQGTYPFVNSSGFEYARRWKFQVFDSLLQGTAVWEVESSSSQEVEVISERPAAKARPSPASESRSIDLSQATQEASSSTSSAVLPTATARPASASEPQRLEASSKSTAKAKDRILRPRVFLPDTVVWYDRRNKAEDIGSGPDPVGENFKEVSNYSVYRGYETYVKAEHPEFPKFIVFLDWHQVLDRSRTQGTWNGEFPRDSITFLQRLKQAAEQTWGHRDALSIVIVSHIEHSSKNLDNLLRICNQYRQIGDEGLITSIFVTRERCGVFGKAATIKSYTLDYKLPCVLVDDNCQVIQENSADIHTCHIQIRRKPSCPEAEVVQHYLLDCAGPLERLFRLYRRRWAKRVRSVCAPSKGCNRSLGEECKSS